ncbi:GCV T domain containing protein [Trichuris trichiura]|uniref:GCV T domain containing protein n=1 Tax=Trichuris trichiura TaxID=36087 RepID=A0A077ZB86_TRITR|nr:GCV T domain containing protein [Trichuris trichiura]
MACWLKNRRLLRLVGPDCVSLLQGLLTNDVTRLNEEKCSALYSLMLNVRGRILYDLFLYRQGQHPTDIWVECDSSVSDSLCSLLRKHVLHKKVDVQLDSTKQVYWFKDAGKPAYNSDEIFVPDPRLACLGARWLSDQKPDDNDGEEKLVEAYSQALPEGANELPPDTSFPHEMSADLLGAVSFSKGCYLGQELTSRVEHIGVVRKRLMPLCFDPTDLPLMRLVQFNSNIYDSATRENVIGRFKAAGSQYAMALLNVTDALRLGTVLLTAKDTEQTRMIRCKVMRPQWWPASVS